MDENNGVEFCAANAESANAEICAAGAETENAAASEAIVSNAAVSEAEGVTAVRDVSKLPTAREKFFSTKTLVKLAVFTALSYVLYVFVKMPLPIFAPWLELQISDLPALMAGFMTGSIGGAVVIVLKCLMKMPLTNTAFVGELGDIFMGLAFVLPPSFIYRRHRSKKGALVGLIIGTAVCTVVSVVINAFVLVPFYVELFCHGDELMLVGMMSGLFPSITWDSFMGYYLGLSVVPFNLLRCALVGVLTFLLYKHTERLFFVLSPKHIRSAK